VIQPENPNIESSSKQSFGDREAASPLPLKRRLPLSTRGEDQAAGEGRFGRGEADVDFALRCSIF